MTESNELGIAEALAYAVELHRDGRLEAAAQIYGRILQAVPDHPDALHFLGVLAHQTGRSELAFGLITKARALVPDHPGVHVNLGNVLCGLGRLDDAVEAYRRAIALQPDNAEIHNNLGAVLRTLGRHDEALAACRRAIELRPDYADAFVNLANVLKEINQLDAAIDAYLKAVSLKRYHAGAYRNLGISLYTVGRSREAVAVYEQWLELEPDNPIARHMLAACAQQAIPERASDAYIQLHFDRFAESFDGQLERLSYRAPQLIAAAVAAFGPAGEGWDILDAGCGTGLCAPLLRPYARRLTGVDLSGKMIEKAGGRELYDELVVAELTAFMAGRPGSFDLIASADTLVYFGVLSAAVEAAGAALRPGGRLVFTVERAAESQTEDFRLMPHGRYAHTETYLRRVLEQAGLQVASIATDTLRMENSQPVAGYVVRATRPLGG